MIVKNAGTVGTLANSLRIGELSFDCMFKKQPAQVLVSGSTEGRMHDFIGRRCAFKLGEIYLF